MRHMLSTWLDINEDEREGGRVLVSAGVLMMPRGCCLPPHNRWSRRFDDIRRSIVDFDVPSLDCSSSEKSEEAPIAHRTDLPASLSASRAGGLLSYDLLV